MPLIKNNPILLDAKHVLMQKIAQTEHIKLMHVGAQALRYNLREKFWILRIRNLTRKVVRECFLF